MNEQQGASRVAEPADPTIRARRLDALQRAHRARKILARQASLAARAGRERTRTTPAAPDRRPPHRPSDSRESDPDGPIDLDELLELHEDLEAPDAIGRSELHPRGVAADEDEDEVDRQTDSDRLVEIHDSLRHERQMARRPFNHRHADRLVLALELAERLALERLGFDDYADFEAHRGEPRPPRDVIDIEELERAAQDLAAAEAELAELGVPPEDTGPDAHIGVPPWTVDPALRPLPVRPTAARRRVFDRNRAGGTAPGDAVAGADAHRDDPDANDQVDAGPAPSSARAPLLPFRRSRAAGRSAGNAGDAGGETDQAVEGDSTLLGELVRDGRTFRVEKVPGVTYADGEDGDGTGLRPDSITYGDPRRLI